MEKYGIGKRCLAFFLSLIMLTTVVTPITVFAAIGDLSNVSTGLTGDIDTSDYISLPIKILDYEADGMLFEYAEAYADAEGREVGASKTAADFGATWAADFASQTAVDNITNSMFGNFWSDVTTSLNTSNSYASRLRVKYNETTADNGGAFYGRASVITPNDLSGIAMNSVRYLVMVYRSNVTSGNIGFWVERENAKTRTDANNRTGDLTFTSEGSTNWTYAVYDLKQGALKESWDSYGKATSIFTTLPLDASGEWIDIAHIALFSKKARATAFGEYALTDGSDRGDNRGFGLLRSSRKQDGSDAYAGVIAETTTVEQLNTYGDTTSVDFSTLTTLGYTLLGTFGEKGIANIGLLQSGLSEKGYPVYKEEVVTYVAKLLKHSLEIPERTDDGWKNYRYVKGTASDVYGGTDLATALRTKINETMGSYAAASGKNLVGTWAEVSGNIASYYDAAYFLLNSIFIPGSYNEEQALYDYLILSAGTDSESQEKIYVFDGGFTTSATPGVAEMAIDYNKTNKTIQNTSAAGKTHFVYESSSTTTLNPFLPVTDDNTADGMTKNPYYQDDGVINGVKKQTTKDTLYERDFNFVMTSHGEFVYHADDELFFNFEGDDDVYLFINGELVLDIGSAHSIDSVSFNINDYVNAAKAGTLGSDARNKALSLEEGNTYSFAFFYMERHSYGSNIRIETNIRVTDPSMETVKTAWQDGVQLDYGSVVDKDKVVEYGFSIINNGEENLYNLTFTDNDIGVTLDPTNGLTVTGSRVFDINGGTLEATDLTAVLSHPDYTDIDITFDDNDGLKDLLRDMTASEETENGAGLFIGATLSIRGIGYKLSEDQIKKGVFDNTVLTTSTNKTESKTLHGQAVMRVFVPADPMYYQWAGHDLKVTKTKLITDVLAAAEQEGNVLAGKVPNLTTSNINKIELVTKAGNAISSSYVTIDGSNNLTINYPTAGSKVFYVKVTYNSSKNTVIVPVLVNVTDVQDSVYVLDYGLSVDLTEIKNDAVTVPGRDTSYSILGFGTNGSYTPNEISFTISRDDNFDGDYGTFAKSGDDLDTIRYTLKNFLEGADVVQIAVSVYENDITPSKIVGTLDINNEVEMYKTITVLPANVLYYEDDFPAINYTDTTNTFTSITGDGSSNLKQSNDQDEQYGHDSTYEGTNVIEDEYSGNSLHTITIDNADTVASFTFTGTGFELISRTNAADSATLVVTVKNSTGAKIKVIPVITQFDNYNNGGDECIYQVPVIRVKDLEHGTYTVEISGVPAYNYNEDGTKGDPKTTYLYIDGLRIYQPIGDTHENYLDTEKGAQFIELRNEIAAGNIAVVKYTDTITVSTSTSTWTENLHGEFIFNEVNSVDDYILTGPNNEVYMTGTYGQSALVFYVKEIGTGAHSLQIALRGIDENLFFSGNTTDPAVAAKVKFGVYQDGNYAWEWLNEKVISSTEQYYVIDYTKCYYDSTKGAYQVVITVDEGMISFSSLKLTGLELVIVNGEKASLKYENGTLYSSADAASYEVANASYYVNFSSVGQQLRSKVIASDLENPQPIVPDPIVPDVADPAPEISVKPDNTTPAPNGQNQNASTNNTHDQANSGPLVYFENYIKKLRELLRKLGMLANDDEVTA